MNKKINKNNKVNTNKVNTNKVNTDKVNNEINTDKVNNEIEELINNNVIRKFSNFLNNNYPLKNVKYSIFYMVIHYIFIFIVAFVGVFNTNIFYLCILLIIVSLDAFSIVVLHECPLTTMERKYMNKSCCDMKNEYLKKANISYNCDHNYENQLEQLINVWMLIAGKCICILFFKTFNIKLFNYNNLYSSVN